MYCNVKAHYSWPICSVQWIAVQRTVCTFFPDLLSRPVLSFTASCCKSVWISSCFSCDWFCCLKFKIESGVTCNMWNIYLTATWLRNCSTVLSCTENCISTQGKCRCVDRLLKQFQKITHSLFLCDKTQICICSFYLPIFLLHLLHK